MNLDYEEEEEVYSDDNHSDNDLLSGVVVRSGPRAIHAGVEGGSG
jgi:hypothetical protein